MRMMLKNLLSSICTLVTVLAQAEHVDDEYPYLQLERPAFTLLDLDGSGEIDFAEFSTQQLPNQNEHNVLFTEMDRDNNGVVNETEYYHQFPTPALMEE